MKTSLKKIALFIVITPVVLLMAGTLIYLLYGQLALGGESTEHQNYLRKYMEPVHLGSANPFRSFDKGFYRNNIFLLGEAHGFAVPQELDLELLKHLNQKVGLRYYLAEVDYSQAHFMNEYLRTGDESLLKYVFQTWVKHNAQWGNNEYYNKIRKIRALNQALPEARRIRIVGVDKVQDLAVTKRYLAGRLAGADGLAPADGLRELGRLVRIDTTGADALRRCARRLLETAGEGALSSGAAGAGQADLWHTIRNLAYPAKLKRDSIMFLNLVALTRTLGLEKEKLYGLWGFYHTLPGTVNGGLQPFASLLRKSGSPYLTKVTAMNIYAIDSDNMMPGKMMPTFLSGGKDYFTTGGANSNGPLVFVQGINDLKAVTQTKSVTLFRMDGDDSPYLSTSRLATTKVLIPGQNIKADIENPAIAQAYNYVFLIRNSPALTPLAQ